MPANQAASFPAAPAPRAPLMADEVHDDRLDHLFHDTTTQVGRYRKSLRCAAVAVSEVIYHIHRDHSVGFQNCLGACKDDVVKMLAEIQRRLQASARQK